MKRTSAVILLALLPSLSSAAPSGETVFPSAAQEFSPINAVNTYMDRHRESALTQPTLAWPSSAVMWDPIQSDDTYMLRHLHDIGTQPSIMFPSSVAD